MRSYVTKSVLGLYAFNEKGELLAKKSFGANIENTVNALLDERVENSFVEELEKKGFKVVLEKNEANLGGRILRENLLEYAKLEGIDNEKLRGLVLETNLTLSRKGISELRPDKLIVNTVNAVEELDRILNVLSERVREWYSLYFPELDRLEKSNEEYMTLVSKHGLREDYVDVKKKIKKAAASSMGMPLEKSDVEVIKKLAEKTSELFEEREHLNKYLDTSMSEIAPNITAVAGSKIGAKLIAITGSMEKLAKIPSSTIQVLGAEKALFRHLKTGSKPPKYGVIYQHPALRVNKNLQGKVARVLAAKIAIAARADYFSGGFIGDELNKDIQEKLRKLKK